MSQQIDRELQLIITEIDSGELMVQRAKRVGQELQFKETTSSQIRAIFGEVRQIEGRWKLDDKEQRTLAQRRLILLKPKMAYRAEREKSLKPLADELESALDFVIMERDEQNKTRCFDNFVEYFEAILAYYTAGKSERSRARR